MTTKAQAAKALAEELASGGLASKMTLRDYFAAKAMQAMLPLCADNFGNYDAKDIAKYSYEMADVMLKVRAK